MAYLKAIWILCDHFGCMRFSIQPFEVKDGKPAAWSVIDEPQLEVVKAAKPVSAVRRLLQPAGPRPDGERAPVPSDRS